MYISVVDLKFAGITLVGAFNKSDNSIYCNKRIGTPHTPKVLRTTIVDAGVSGLVENLLSDRDHDVVLAAVAAVCNLLSAAAPMKKVWL